MIFELERAERVRDPFDRVRERMGEVVHRVDAPGVAGPMVRGVADPVQRRITHVQIGRRHVDLRAQHVGAVGKLAGPHAGEEIQALLRRTPAIRAVAARLGERSAVRPDLIGVETVDVGQIPPDELDRKAIQLLEIVGGVAQFVPAEPEPCDVGLDALDVLGVLLRGVRVVESQVAPALKLRRNAEVQADGLGVADVQIAVRLGRKPCGDTPAVRPRRDVLLDDGAYEVGRSGDSRCIRLRIPGGHRFDHSIGKFPPAAGSRPGPRSRR